MNDTIYTIQHLLLATPKNFFSIIKKMKKIEYIIDGKVNAKCIPATKETIFSNSHHFFLF
jgi:hypothetical protein